MKMQEKMIYISVMAYIIIFGLFACSDLTVENENDPTTEIVLSTPIATEALIGGSFQDWWHANQHPGVSMPLAMVADELTSQWGNWSMSTWAREPRKEIVNTPSASQAELMERGFQGIYNAVSAVNDGLAAVKRGIYVDSLRAFAFGRFMQGLVHCNSALFFDQGYIVDENTDLEGDISLHPYQDVFEAGKGFLDDCIEICEEYQFSSPTPEDWIYGNSIDSDQLKRLAHSYYARYLAGMARTPSERAAADWDAIIDHASQGITTPFRVSGDGNLWWDGLKYFSSNPDWTRVDYFVIGPADTSGSFETWVNSEPADREAFIIYTADRRIVGPDSATAPGTDFRYAGPSYFFSYRDSYYEPQRYESHFLTGAVAPASIFNPAELRLLIAEGYFRQSNLSGAADIINETRVSRGELPPATASDTDLFEKLKYEKRIETHLTAGGLQWIEKRGWGDLGTGAPLHLPVPAVELEILLLDFYTFGGEDGDMAAKRAQTKMNTQLNRTLSWF